jgi:hypothetical protein
MDNAHLAKIAFIENWYTAIQVAYFLNTSLRYKNRLNLGKQIQADNSVRIEISIQ